MQQAAEFIKLDIRERQTPPSPSIPLAGKSKPTAADDACAYCRSIGWVYKPDPEMPNRKSISVPCPRCGVARLVRGLQNFYPLPPEWEDYELAEFKPTAGEERQYAQALRYAAAPRGWIVFQGGPGTGKTMMFVGVMNALKRLGKLSLFLPARTLGDLVHQALDPDIERNLKRLESDLRYVDFLVIDEFDKLDWSKTFVHDTLFALLNWRYEHLALTAIAFNDDARIVDPTPALYSRLRDGRWGDGRGTQLDDGILRSTADDVRPYLNSLWVDA